MPKAVVEIWFAKPLKLVAFDEDDPEYHTHGHLYATEEEDFWILRGLVQRNYLNVVTIPDHQFRDLTRLFCPHLHVNLLWDIYSLHDDDPDEGLRMLCGLVFTLARRVVYRSPDMAAKIIDALFESKWLEGKDVFNMCTPFKKNWEALFVEGATSERLEAIRKEHFV